jgi:hypothetical protein
MANETKSTKPYRVAKKTYTYVELQHMTEAELKSVKKLLRDNVTRNLRKLQKGGYSETPATIGLSKAIESGIVTPMPKIKIESIKIASLNRSIKKIQKAHDKAKKAKAKAKAKAAKEKAKAEAAKEKAEFKEAKEKAKQLRTMAKEAEKKKKTELTEKQRLMGEIFEYQTYQESSTGTLAGMRKFETETEERLGDAYRDSSIESKRKFWKLYEQERGRIEDNGLGSAELQKELADYFSAENGKRITRQRREYWEALVDEALDKSMSKEAEAKKNEPKLTPFKIIKI